MIVFLGNHPRLQTAIRKATFEEEEEKKWITYLPPLFPVGNGLVQKASCVRKLKRQNESFRGSPTNNFARL